MTAKTLALIGLFLLSSCSSCNNPPYQPRPAFEGKTYGDLATYTGQLEIMYDSHTTKPQ